MSATVTKIEKEVPVETPEIVIEKQIQTLTFGLEDSISDDQLIHLRQATLYHDIMYTVVPKDHNLALGVLPQDQGFHSGYVVLWDTYRDLFKFSAEDWRKLEVKIPPDVKRDGLRHFVGTAYGIAAIPNTWDVQDQSSTPRYVE